MGLSEKEKKMLDRLTKKAEEPDAPAMGTSRSFHIDLSDNKAVALAKSLGLLGGDDDDDDDDDEDDDREADDTPNRGGFFGGK